MSLEETMAEAALEDDDEEVEWERSQSIPQPSDPFIQKYFQGRDALIEQEEKHRSDRTFRDDLSPMAREASAIFAGIRFEELNTVWDPDYEDESTPQDDKSHVYPGMMFTLAKERMERTKTWQIVRRMPKGALLHCHLDAMFDPNHFFQEALETKGMCISAEKGLSTLEDKQTSALRFQYADKSAKPDVSIWSSEYPAHTLVPISKAAESFPDGGREGFLKWFKSRCTLSYEDAVDNKIGLNAIWQKFLQCFGILRGLIYYEPLFRKHLQHMFAQLAEDGVRYVDARAAFHFEFRNEGSEEPLAQDEGFARMIQVFGEEIKRFQDTQEGKAFWGARIIWTTIRAFSNRTIAENMRSCVAAKLAYPELIAGYDLVGQEDLGRPLADLVPLLFWFRKLCSESGVNIPFFFHAGETMGSGSQADDNLYDAILLGTRRIGHGFSLYKHPLLSNMVRDKRLCVECCPISNEVLRLTGSIESHPVPAMLANGVPVSLCNDDPGILGQGHAGMSHDFWQAGQGIESLGLEGMGALAENSVRWAAFEDQSNAEWTDGVKNGIYGKGLRAQRMKDWKREWEKFCQWIILEYGVDIDVDPDE